MPLRPTRSYIICTTPRSGSTLLCGLLQATGVAGVPGSHFHTPSLARWCEVYGLDPAHFPSRQATLGAVFEAAIRRGRGDGTLFGLRLQHGSLAFFLGALREVNARGCDDRQRIETVFGPTTFLHLTRPDRLDQAISRLRAEQSGLWHRRADGTDLERQAPGGDVSYDADAVTRHMAEAVAGDAAWRTWFERTGIAPLTLTYDDLSHDPRKVLARVLTALDLDPARAGQVDIPTARLADAESRAWKDRYRAEHPD